MFKLGDIVKVKKDLIPGQEYGGLVFYPGKMADTAGLIGTIDKLKDGGYRLKGYPFIYSQEMLLLIESPTTIYRLEDALF